MILGKQTPMAGGRSIAVSGICAFSGFLARIKLSPNLLPQERILSSTFGWSRVFLKAVAISESITIGMHASSDSSHELDSQSGTDSSDN